MLFPILRRNIQRELQALAFVFDEAINCVPDQPRHRNLPPLRHETQQAALLGRQGCRCPRILAHPRRASECITLLRHDAQPAGRIKTIRELPHSVLVLFYFQLENGGGRRPNPTGISDIQTLRPEAERLVRSEEKAS